MTDRDRGERTSMGQFALVCPMCESGSLVTRHCKRVCERCGYVESCEDNFLPIQENPSEVAPSTH